jgi:hypothetical protein
MREAALFGMFVAPLFLGLFVVLTILLPTWKFVIGAIAALGAGLCILWIVFFQFTPDSWVQTKPSLMLVTSAYCYALAAFVVGCLALGPR